MSLSLAEGAVPAYLHADHVLGHRDLTVVAADGARLRANRLLFACLTRHGSVSTGDAIFHLI